MRDTLAAESETAIREGSKSFAAAARLLAPRMREDATMLYAWCRHCDDVIDEQVLGSGERHAGQADAPARLAHVRRGTAAALSGAPTPNAAFAALARVLGRNAIPARHPEELLRGFGMDVEGRRYETISDTLDYCYHVAGVVGVMMAMIMDARAPEDLDRASDLGIAFQLTNIARDIIDDARAGRVYLPREMLRRHGIERLDPEDPAQRAALWDCARELLDLADAYYASAWPGLGALPPRGAWAVAAAGRIYHAIGGRMRRLGPASWDKRARTSRGRKLALLTLALGDAAASRFRRRDRPRIGLYERP